VLISQRLLPEGKNSIFLQGSVSFTLPKGHYALNVYCSPHNQGAHELAAELNDEFSTRKTRKSSSSRRTRETSEVRGSFSLSRSVSTKLFRESSRKLRFRSFHSASSHSIARATGSGDTAPAQLDHQNSALSRVSRVSRTSGPIQRGIFGLARAHSRGLVSGETQRGHQLLRVVDNIAACDHMLLYLNAATWTESEGLMADIEEARRQSKNVQLCHESPSALDPESLRQPLDFKQIMEATPAHLRRGERSIYKTIAVSLKGGDMRRDGLAQLAAKLSVKPQSAVERSTMRRWHSVMKSMPRLSVNQSPSVQRWSTIMAMSGTQRSSTEDGERSSNEVGRTPVRCRAMLSRPTFGRVGVPADALPPTPRERPAPSQVQEQPPGLQRMWSSVVWDSKLEHSGRASKERKSGRISTRTDEGSPGKLPHAPVAR